MALTHPKGTRAVQQQCIPVALQGQDVLGQAKAGVGKTAVFVLAVLHQLEPEDGKVSAIVVAHTRELAQQVRTIIGFMCARFRVSGSPGLRGEISVTKGGECSMCQNVASLRVCPASRAHGWPCSL